MGKPTDRSTAAADSGAVDEESRASRFMRSALAILGETGRTDFTVLEVVERSKTSLRSFYQHFSTKDELLLALIDKIMAESTLSWREATDGLDATTALRRPGRAHQRARIHVHPGQHQPWSDLLQRPPRRDRCRASMRACCPRCTYSSPTSSTAGSTKAPSHPRWTSTPTAALIMQTVLGAMRLRVLGAELNGVPIEAGTSTTFCVRALAK